VLDLTGDDRATILGALRRESRRSRQTRQHTRRQIELLQRFVVDA
jgi:hypothetical protein